MKIIIRNLIQSYKSTNDENKQIEIIVYYKKLKTFNMIITNDPIKRSKLQQTYVVYEFKRTI